VFDTLRLITEPDKEVKIRVWTNAVDEAVSNRSGVESYFSSMDIKLFVRPCVSGESLINSECVECPPGYYSIELDSSK
jgi:hypothetical protein